MKRQIILFGYEVTLNLSVERDLKKGDVVPFVVQSIGPLFHPLFIYIYLHILRVLLFVYLSYMLYFLAYCKHV